MRFLIIHQLDNPSAEAMAAEAALIKTMLRDDPVVVRSDVLLSSSRLHQQMPAARLQVTQAHAPVVLDPWMDTAEYTRSFLQIDVPDHEAALAWAQQWPVSHVDSVVEVRAVGCPGGVHCVSGDIPAEVQPDTEHFMVIIHEESLLSEGTVPPQSVLDGMERYNIESVESGILLAGHGLHPSPDGTRVKFTAGKSSVIDGPFSESKELIAGYWLIQTKSKSEAIEWAKNYPFPVFNSATISVLPVVGLEHKHV
ncbi:YciI family protein [Aquirhabdus sp.]|uniref:YciI family protein n=1 Tax=Aquirhabdus sp. TaxID=2824160 RepID=UPI00396C8D6D